MTIRFPAHHRFYSQIAYSEMPAKLNLSFPTLDFLEDRFLSNFYSKRIIKPNFSVRNHIDHRKNTKENNVNISIEMNQLAFDFMYTEKIESITVLSCCSMFAHLEEWN